MYENEGVKINNSRKNNNNFWFKHLIIYLILGTELCCFKYKPLPLFFINDDKFKHPFCKLWIN